MAQIGSTDPSQDATGDFPEGLTFDDVLLVPQLSDVLPKDVVLDTRFSRNVNLRAPIASAAMDTVTEWALGVALARTGGIGIIHRNLSIERQVEEVDKVKRSANGVILDPVTLTPHETIGEARAVMQRQNISGLPVCEGGKVVGILTSRDCRFEAGDENLVGQIMTSENLVTSSPKTSLEEARELLFRHKVEKLILVDDSGALKGLITMKDIKMLEEYPYAAMDSRGRLRAGAAIGVRDYERAEGLVSAGVDVLVVDTAHGHSTNVIETVRELKKLYEVDVVAGNVATAEAAVALEEAGVDGIKVGIGPGSICTTRIIAGIGVPQLSAVRSVAAAVKGGVPVIADGGIRFSGDMVKALAVGASCIMLGSLLAGLDESPGETILYKGRSFKTVRGMGSIGAMQDGSKERYRQGDVQEADKLVPEGIEGMVPYRGPLAPFVHQMNGGIRAGLGYVGAANIAELWERARFVRLTAAGMHESHPHDVSITKESPNYHRPE